ncbi:Glucan endo-1,3-beta-glucosidase [Quillaja saponaria]|uniref:Glucan endo-1,3-beta-glucosidase n=1 Tax=Quillaja saponaria TaxID=32244 RepID=A0AAD7P9K8_QUISA|nr:Glucan endo-1,3-beta-glucosidase [Quillaja saponaria]
MSAYFQGTARLLRDCNFNNSALIAIDDPSCESCHYPGRDAYVDTSESGKWCVAKPLTEENILQQNINFACNYVNCSSIKPGGACEKPDTRLNHACY